MESEPFPPIDWNRSIRSIGIHPKETVSKGKRKEIRVADSQPGFLLSFGHQSSPLPSQGMACRGTYVGDVTALHLLRDEDGRGAWLLYGMGGQVWIHPTCSGRKRNANHGIQVTHGCRVHGLHSRYKEDGKWDLVVFGDKLVSLWRVEEIKHNLDAQLIPCGVLPRFNRWVMNVALPNLTDGTSQAAYSIENEGRSRRISDTTEQGKEICLLDGNLAVGLSDNAVQLWDLKDKICLSEYHCSVPALLYSMELDWKQEGKIVHVISGTAFCTILCWKIELISSPQQCCHALELRGHEGSIHRLRWIEVDKQLVSASDDRTLRIWDLELIRCRNVAHNSHDGACIAILYGHTGRIWDVDIQGSILASASEDGTVRLWSRFNGSVIGVLKAHLGRGAWRCAMDLQQASVFSGGADASVKYWDVQELINAKDSVELGRLDCSNAVSRQGVQHIVHSGIEKDGHPMADSSSEYIRCMHVPDKSRVFLGTNRGKVVSLGLQLGEAELFPNAAVDPTEMSPSVMSLHALHCNNKSLWLVAAGNIEGGVTLSIFNGGDCLRNCNWTAHAQNRVLTVKIFECTLKGNSTYLVMSLDACGGACLWNTGTDLSLAQPPKLLLRLSNPFGVRYTCGDLSSPFDALVFGDQKGNVVFYQLHTDIMAQHPESTAISLRCQHSKGAIVTAQFIQEQDGVANFFTTGHDGTIRFYTQHIGAEKSISCYGVQRASDISMVLNYCTVRGGDRIVAGFHARDFVVYNVSQNSEIFRKPCGGWRRPVSFLCTDSGENELAICFCFVTNGQIHTYLKMSPFQSKDCSVLVNGAALCTAYHGKEIHSSSFIPFTHCPILITGAEDGLLRTLHQVNSLNNQWSETVAALQSLNIGEHAAGTIVKATCVLSTDVHNQYMLISGGSKEVLMTWHLSVKCIESPRKIFDVSTLWLSTKPPKEGLHPTSQKQTESQHRCMSLAALRIRISDESSVVLIASGSSDSTISTFAFDSRTRKWKYLQSLKYHTCPVLDVKLLRLGDCAFLLSCSSDGCCCIWDLSSSMPGILDGVWDFRNPSEEIYEPMQALSTLHAAGANSIAASSINEESLLLVVAGEDNSISLYQIKCKGSDRDFGDRLLANLLFQCTIPAAHMCAVKSVWTDGKHIFSSGLDQCVRMWVLCFNNDKVATGVKHLHSCAVEVPEIETMSVWNGQHGGGFVVAVSGRGSQFVQFAKI